MKIKLVLFATILLLKLLSLPLSAQRLPISTPTETEAAADPGLSWESYEAKWSEVSSIDGRFKIMSPGEFQEKTDTIVTALGDQVYHTFFFQPTAERRENEVYMLSYVDYPEGTLHHDSTTLLQELFTETQDAAASTVRGDVLFSKDGAQNGYPYRYWRVDYLGGRASIRTKAIVRDNRFYTVQTVSQRAQGMNSSTDRFIDSFRVF